MPGKPKSLKGTFEDAKARVEGLASRPSNEELLQLYGLYKQATEGDVTGKRPGILDMVGRAKHDAWSARQYVRLEIDRDAISLRSAPTNLETWPWGDEPDGRLVGNLDASGFYLTGSEWLHFVFEARRASDGVHWTAQVTNPATGVVLADLSALEASPTPLEGTFFLHGYSLDAGRMWANLVFDATIDTSN